MYNLNHHNGTNGSGNHHRKEIIIHKKLVNIGQTITTSIEKTPQNSHHNNQHNNQHNNNQHNNQHHNDHHHHHGGNNSENNGNSNEPTSATLTTVTTITFDDIAKYFDLKLEGIDFPFFLELFHRCAAAPNFFFRFFYGTKI